MNCFLQFSNHLIPSLFIIETISTSVTWSIAGTALIVITIKTGVAYVLTIRIEFR